jgi:hypothetical protein
MAQATYVTSSIVAPITGASAKQFTNPISSGSRPNRGGLGGISLADVPARKRRHRAPGLDRSVEQAFRRTIACDSDR